MIREHVGIAKDTLMRFTFRRLFLRRFPLAGLSSVAKSKVLFEYFCFWTDKGRTRSHIADTGQVHVDCYVGPTAR